MKLAAGAAACFAAASLQPAAAQKPDRDPQEVQLGAGDAQFVVRVHSGIRDNVVRFLMEIGEPSTVTLNAGEDVGARILAKCGHSRELYLLEARRLNPGRMDAQGRAVEAGDLRLPACARFETQASLFLATETPVADLLERETGFRGPITLEGFNARNPEVRRSANPSLLPAGTTVVLPYRSAWTTIEIRPSSNFTPKSARARLNQLLSMRASRSDRVSANSGIAPVGTIPPTLSAAFQSAEGQCRAPEAGQQWPFDSGQLLEVLRWNRSAADRAQRRLREARIAILDSGFVTPPVAPFVWARLAVREGPAGASNYYGLNTTTRTDPPLAHPNMRDADHGTMVATLALGGRGLLTDTNPDLEGVRLRLYAVARPLPAGEGQPEVPEVQETFVLDAVNDALANEAYIINTSFEFRSQMLNFPTLVSAQSRLLIVTAAGNTPESVDDQPRWPASFGGNGGPLSPQVITVGASGADGALTSFSSFGWDKVDILAPGCAMPTLDLQLAEREPRGTSFAAPMVAFTAALIRQYGDVSGAQLKERLVVGTDVHVALYDRVWASGVLNPVKAADLFVDRIEMDGVEGPLRGTIDWDSTGDWTCRDTPDIPRRGRVLKAARLDRPGADPDWMIIWRTNSGDLKRCRADLRNEFVAFSQVGTDETQTLPLAAVRDLISAFQF